MNIAQRKGYFRRWKQACACQGWTGQKKAENDAIRYREQAKALKGKSISSANLTEAEIDTVFDYFEILAKTTRLDAAIQVDLPPATNDNPRRNRQNREMLDPGRVRRWKWNIFQKQIPALKRLGIENPLAYVERICQNTCKTADPEHLDAWEIRNLMITLNNRIRTLEKSHLTDTEAPAPASESIPVKETAENPF